MSIIIISYEWNCHSFNILKRLIQSMQLSDTSNHTSRVQSELIHKTIMFMCATLFKISASFQLWAVLLHHSLPTLIMYVVTCQQFYLHFFFRYVIIHQLYASGLSLWIYGFIAKLRLGSTLLHLVKLQTHTHIEHVGTENAKGPPGFFSP